MEAETKAASALPTLTWEPFFVKLQVSRHRFNHKVIPALGRLKLTIAVKRKMSNTGWTFLTHISTVKTSKFSIKSFSPSKIFLWAIRIQSLTFFLMSEKQLRLSWNIRKQNYIPPSTTPRDSTSLSTSKLSHKFERLKNERKWQKIK